jgi:hypothetical protein
MNLEILMGSSLRVEDLIFHSLPEKGIAEGIAFLSDLVGS